MGIAYQFYGEINYAETWRDADDIKRFDEHIFTDFDKMSQYVINFINEKIEESYIYKDYDKLKKIELDNNGCWHYTFMGSWAPTYYVKTIEID